MSCPEQDSTQNNSQNSNDLPLPNFQIGSASPTGLTSNIFNQNNGLHFEDGEESFVVLAKNVVEPISASSPTFKEDPLDELRVTKPNKVSNE